MILVATRYHDRFDNLHEECLVQNREEALEIAELMRSDFEPDSPRVYRDHEKLDSINFYEVSLLEKYWVV